VSPAPDPRTRRGRVGLAAEAAAGRYLEGLGWQVLARNLIVDRDEIDLVCLDAERGTLVVVEVRGHSTGRFGAAEESLDRRKVARNCRAAMALLRSGWTDRQGLPPGIAWRVDVIAVELAPTLGPGVGGASIRHVRGVTLD
jgi:Holliday junction resolvase-like predicted endonuclease